MISAPQLLIEKAEAGHGLSRAEAETFMEELLSGRVATPEIARMLLALNQRAVSVDELSGFARVMRQHAAPVFAQDEPRPTGLVDTCGTGGDETGTFNISTASAIVAAAAGARVAKHGNRSVSSRSGSADVLEALGVNIDLPLAVAGRSVREIGIGFLFAPAAHAAARHAIPARLQIVKRTVFNLLGPWCNPARVPRQVIGVSDQRYLPLFVTTARTLQQERVLIVHGSADKIDEFSVSGETQIAEVYHGSVTWHQVDISDFGLEKAPLHEISGGDCDTNSKHTLQIIEGRELGPRRSIVLMTAASAIYVAGHVRTLRAGLDAAREVIDSGCAATLLTRLRRQGGNSAEVAEII